MLLHVWAWYSTNRPLWLKLVGLSLRCSCPHVDGSDKIFHQRKFSWGIGIIGLVTRTQPMSTRRRKGQEIFLLLQATNPVSGAHQASKAMSTGGIYHGVKLFNREAQHLTYLVPRLRMHAVIASFLSTPSWQGQNVSKGSCKDKWDLARPVQFLLTSFVFPVRGCERAGIVTKCVRFHTGCDFEPLTLIFISREPLTST
jgi:hypothetical protein